MTDRLPELPEPVAFVAALEEGKVLFLPRPSLAGGMVGIFTRAEVLAAYRAGLEAAAQIADAKAARLFPWGSENSDTYHAQADWAQHIGAAIRRAAEEPTAGNER